MFIAHLPSGYILAKFLDNKLKQTKISVNSGEKMSQMAEYVNQR